MISCKAVGFDYGALRVIDGLHLEVDKHELLACVGPSGCGKSTLLSLLAGHLKPTRGTIQREGASRTIYQDGGLFPWLTVAQNIALGNPSKVGEWLEITRLADFAGHYAHELSGGMRQRVELARSLAAETDILFMDEPFGALDYQTRNRMRRELVATLAERPRTVVFVTHDIEEAVQIGDRVVVLDPRPTRVKRVLELPGGRSRAPAAPGVAEAEQTIMEELGL
jgi:ABC-type nitrate/sulfonate/bicarbonate transport system ATPase subunit